MSLGLHNIFFSNNYQEEFKHLFDSKSVYHDPTVYINISSKHQPNDAPEGCENWFTMVNVPNNIGQDWEQFKTQARANILKKLQTIPNSKVWVTTKVLEAVFFTKIAIIDRGKIYAEGTPKDLIQQTDDAHNLEDVFISLTGKELRDNA